MPLRIFDNAATDARYAVKVAAAATSAYVLATLLHLPQGYWSVISALMVVQASLGGTLAAAQERAVGTLAGAVVGGLAAYLHPHSLATTSLTLTCVVGILAFAAAGRPMLRLAPVTAAILIVATATQPDQIAYAIERVLEVTLGCGVGVAATILIFPSRLEHDVARDARTVAGELGELLRSAPQRASDPAGRMARIGAHDSIRRKLAALDKTIADSRRTPGARPLVEALAALVRALRRIRNDAVGVERALGATDAARDVVGPPALALIYAAADMLAMIAAGGELSHVRTELAVHATELEDAVVHIRDLDADHEFEIASAVPTIGLVFALRNLVGNLGDLPARFNDARSSAAAE